MFLQACVAAFAPATPRVMQRAQVQMNMGNKVNTSSEWLNNAVEQNLE